MHITNLRKVGGSVMLAVPPAVLDLLQLGPGAKVGLSVEGGRLVVEPSARPRYELAELLAQCAPLGKRGKAEREWVTSRAQGKELL